MEKTGTLTGKHVLLIIIIFFGVMIFANVMFIRAAVTSFPGVSEEHSYLQGLHYNDKLAARAAQAELGWRASVNAVEREAGMGRIVLAFETNGAPLSGLTVSGVVKRPVHDDEDLVVVFNETGGGLYEAQVDDFAAGAWDLSVRAENNLGDMFDMDARIIAP